MERKNIIVIGASAGGLEALRRLFSKHSKGVDASVFIVCHMPPDVYGILPRIMSKVSSMEVAHAIDNEPIKLNRLNVSYAYGSRVIGIILSGALEMNS